MEIRTVRKPGEKGTQALMKKYGERLVCIRYRYDPFHKKRYKTVELIVAEQDWHPPEPHPQEEKASGLIPRGFYTRRLGIRLSQLETELRKRIVAAGGMWDPTEKLWFLPEEEVRRLGLIQRVSKR
jgi:hypothetical protein